MSDKEVQYEFLKKIYEFRKNLDELRDFVDVSAELLEQKHKGDVESNPTAYAAFLVANHESHPEVALLSDQDKKEIAARFPEKFEIVESSDGDDAVIQVRVRNLEVEDLRRVEAEIERALNRNRSLLNSALISLISVCEWFAAQLLHYFLDRYPDAADLGKKQVAYEDLLAFDSVDDARKFLVSERVEGLLRGSFQDWIDFFVTKVKIRADNASKHLDHCAEACLRRNLLVHNGATVNKIYLKKAPPKLVVGFSEGAKVGVDREYFLDRLDRFEVVFLEIALELWRKADKSDVSRCNAAIQLIFDALVQERWLVACHLAEYVESQKNAPEAMLLIARVNRWQSYKWTGRFNEVLGEVRGWDVSAKDLMFQMAKHVLLDEADAARSKIERLLATSALSVDDLHRWPLFRGVRNEAWFVSLASSGMAGPTGPVAW